MHKGPSLLCFSFGIACTSPGEVDDTGPTMVTTAESFSSTSESSSSTSETEGTEAPDLGVCEQYLTCVEAAVPEMYVANKVLYGPEGTCWTMPGITEADCHLECRALLRALIEGFPEVDECAECVTDDDCPTDMPYCYNVESICRDLPHNQACEPMAALTFDNGTSAMVEGSTSGASDLYSGSCGGAGGSEQVHRLVAPNTGDYYIILSADFYSVLYLREGDDCTGDELACDGEVSPEGFIAVSLESNQPYTIFVDSHDGSGSYSLFVTYVD